LTEFTAHKEKIEQTSALLQRQIEHQTEGTTTKMISSYGLQSSQKWLRKPGDRYGHATYLSLLSFPGLQRGQNKTKSRGSSN